MVKHKLSQTILEKFLLVSELHGNFYFIDSSANEKSSLFKDKKTGLKILESWFSEERITPADFLDLITLMYEKNEMPFLFFSSDKRRRKNFSEENLIVHQNFINKINELKFKIKGLIFTGASL